MPVAPLATAIYTHLDIEKCFLYFSQGVQGTIEFRAISLCDLLDKIRVTSDSDVLIFVLVDGLGHVFSDEFRGFPIGEALSKILGYRGIINIDEIWYWAVHWFWRLSIVISSKMEILMCLAILEEGW